MLLRGSPPMPFCSTKITIRGAGSSLAADIDFSCVMFGSAGQMLDAVYYNQKEVGGVRHLGDNVKAGIGDAQNQETFEIDLGRVSVAVSHLFFVLTSYSVPWACL